MHQNLVFLVAEVFSPPIIWNSVYLLTTFIYVHPPKISFLESLCFPASLLTSANEPNLGRWLISANSGLETNLTLP